MTTLREWGPADDRALDAWLTRGDRDDEPEPEDNDADEEEADRAWSAALAALDGAALPDEALRPWATDAEAVADALARWVTAHSDAPEVPRYLRVVAALGCRLIAVR
jgi:hypothetical protein